MGGGSDLAVAGQPRQKRLHVGPAQVFGMLFAVEADEGLAPMHIGFFSAQAVVQKPDSFAQLIEQPRRLEWR